MPKANDIRPQLSYVLTAMSDQEVHNVACWLRTNSLSPAVEIVLAAPAKVFSRVAARAVPSHIRLASADGVVDRKGVQVAGARETTGLVVICVSCEDDFESQLRDPFAVATSDNEDPREWAGNVVAELPPARVEIRSGPVPR